MPSVNGSVDRLVGPPIAPPASRRPAPLSMICAKKMPIMKSRPAFLLIDAAPGWPDRAARAGCAAPFIRLASVAGMSCTGPLVFSDARDLRLVRRRRRPAEVQDAAWASRSPTDPRGATVNSPVARDVPREAGHRQVDGVGPKVSLRACFVEMSASGRVPSSTRLNSGARPSVSLNSCLFAVGRHRPALVGRVAGHAGARVRAQRLEERVGEDRSIPTCGTSRATP